MFAGPNGSGKSTLKLVLPEKLLGVYLNPDEIELEIRRVGSLNLKSYGVTNADDALQFFRRSALLMDAVHAAAVERLVLRDACLSFAEVELDSYFASVAADYLRQNLLRQGVSFTFETVMSHTSKVDLLEQAQRAGYRTYLYFVATDDPEINISRVQNRVRLGGHAVPVERIAPRYYRSLELLMEAIRHTNRAYVFDNSGENSKHTWLAEITEGKELELKTDRLPAWFRRVVIDKIKPRTE